MSQNQQATEAFTKIIEHAPSSVLRKAAKSYWTAYNSENGASDASGSQFEAAIRAVSIDYRRPAMECIDDFEKAKESAVDHSECYLKLAICIAEKIVHVM